MSVIVCYGVSAHCKALVDATSGFQVRSQLGRAAITLTSVMGILLISIII